MLQSIFELLKVRLRTKGGPTERELPDGLRFVSSQEYSRRVEEVRKGFDKFLPRMRFGGISWSYPGVRARLLFSPTWSKIAAPTVMAVVAIKSLGEEGLLNRVRQCRKCRRWFYARVRHQEFCSVTCQQSHYRSSKEWKEHRRKWMRRYRRVIELGNTE